MGYTINWDNDEKTVVLQQYTQGATKDDWYQMAQESAKMLGTVSHTVHIIIDERNVFLLANAKDMSYLEKLVPPNEGICIMVVSRYQFLYKTEAKKLREQFFPNSHHEAYFVETIDEARQLLQEKFGVIYATSSDGS